MMHKYRRLGLLLIGIGLLFGFESYTGISFISKMWPVIPLILGTGFIQIFVKRKTGGIAFLALGEYLVCFSCLALYCNITSWQNIVRFWPLFIGFLGIVFLTLFLIDRQRRILSFFGFLFVSLSASFYSMFAIDIRLWWTSFILLGLSIFVSIRIK